MSYGGNLPTLRKTKLALQDGQYILHNGTVTKVNVQEFPNGTTQSLATVGGKTHIVIPEPPRKDGLNGQKFEEMAWNMISSLQRRLATEEAKKRSLNSDLAKLQEDSDKMEAELRQAQIQLDQVMTMVSCLPGAPQLGAGFFTMHISSNPFSGARSSESTSGSSSQFATSSNASDFDDSVEFTNDEAESWLTQNDAVKEDGRWTKEASFVAARKDSVSALKWLSRRNLIKDSDFSASISHRAAAGGALNVLKWLKKRNFLDSKRLDSSGWSVAHYAAVNNHVNVLEWMYAERMLDVHLKNESGNTVVQVSELKALAWIQRNVLHDVD